MVAKTIMVLSAGLLPAGLLAIVLLHSGWEAVVAALCVGCAAVLMASLLYVAAMGDRRAGPPNGLRP